jgi:hypothetical protein
LLYTTKRKSDLNQKIILYSLKKRGHERHKGRYSRHRRRREVSTSPEIHRRSTWHRGTRRRCCEHSDTELSYSSGSSRDIGRRHFRRHKSTNYGTRTGTAVHGNGLKYAAIPPMRSAVSRKNAKVEKGWREHNRDHLSSDSTEVNWRTISHFVFPCHFIEEYCHWSSANTVKGYA